MSNRVKTACLKTKNCTNIHEERKIERNRDDVSKGLMEETDELLYNRLCTVT